MSTRVQAKLAVSSPDDPSELEADRVADQVMRMPASGAGIRSGPAIVQRACAECEGRQRHEERDEEPSPIERHLAASRGHGEPLPSSTLACFESRFGHDFGGVRIHTDSAADAAARQIDALAFTSGSSIHFAAGRFRPGTDAGDRLLAHELVHTIQQTGGSPAAEGVAAVQRFPSARDVLDSVEDVVGTARDTASGAIDTTRRVAGSALDDVSSAVDDARRTIVDTGGQVIDEARQTVADVRAGVSEAASAASDWLASEAGQAAQALANVLGGIVTVTQQGLVITIGRTCPIDAFTHAFELDPIDKDYLAPIFGVELGTLLLTGEVGVVGHLQPLAEVQLGPICLDGVRIVVNPLTSTYSISGSVSATAALSLGAEVRGGVRGELHLAGVIPIGDIPVPIDVSLVGAEGGIAGLFRGIGAGTLTIAGALGMRGGSITVSATPELKLGLAADAFLGAYAQLDVLGENVCRIYWQPYEWHGDVAASIGIDLGLTITPGGTPALAPRISPPTFSRVPFDQIPLALSREGFADDCPIKDRICEILDTLGLLPSQNGGEWNWGGPYGPGPRLAGPLDVYTRDPAIPSGALCRGACGIDCDTCTPYPTYRYTDPLTGEVWEYTNFQDCNTNDGCREHDAAFDWAADVHGETGRWAIVMPWHMSANVECTCNNLAGNCIAWIIGLPPYDGKLYFADTATLVPGGAGSTTLSSSCAADYPGAPACLPAGSDRDETLLNWGALYGIEGFSDCQLVASYPNASLGACGGPGSLWQCLATDTVSGRAILVDIYECICCEPDDSSGSTWTAPTALLEGLPEEVACDLCARGAVSAAVCDAYLHERSAAVPSLTRDVWCRARTAIDAGNCADALTILLDGLATAGQINPALADWSFVARGDRGEGLTTWTWVEDPVTHDRRATAPVNVEIYSPACLDVGWMFSTIMHEYLHVLQALAGSPAGEFDPSGRSRPEFSARREVESYLWEIEHAVGSGLINNRAQMRDLGDRLTDHFNAMTPALQAEYRVRYDAAQRRVADAVAGRPHLSYDEARRIVQDSSREIAELLSRRRRGNETTIDAQIELVRRRRAEALIEVALVENPQIQVVRPGDPGTYRVPTLDETGRVRYLYGGIQVAWHMGEASPSAYSLGEQLGVGGDMAVAGTAVQGQVQPFPPDIDFDEHIHVIANTQREAGRLAAIRIIDGIRRVHGRRIPGSTDIEFRYLLSFPRGRGASSITMPLGAVLGGGAVATLGNAIASLNGGNLNTFWRGWLDRGTPDERFTMVTRVVYVTANRPDGTRLLRAGSSDDFNLAFLEDPGSIATTDLGSFAFQMCCDAVRRANFGDWLKAAKRAYNYFSTTGDMANMARLEPVFRQPEARVEQYATVLDGIQVALETVDERRRGRVTERIPEPRTRIITVDEARNQTEEVARIVETELTDSGAAPSPSRIATDLRRLEGRLLARNPRGQLAQDDPLAGQYDLLARAIRVHIGKGVQGTVEPVIDSAIRPVCDTTSARAACSRR